MANAHFDGQTLTNQNVHEQAQTRLHSSRNSLDFDFLLFGVIRFINGKYTDLFVFIPPEVLRCMIIHLYV